MKVTYTEAASRELDHFQERQKHLLEQLISERKYVFGDESLEVTASDIKETAALIRPVSRSRSRFRTMRFVGRAYIIFGSFLALGSLVYPYFAQLLKQNQPQAIILLGGVAMAATGGFALFYANLRERRFEILERDMRSQLESITLLKSLKAQSKSLDPKLND